MEFSAHGRMTSEQADERLQWHVDRLRDSGLRTLTGAVFDSGGVIRGKTVPLHRVEDFARAGMGASFTWPVFCVDNSIAMTDELNVIGDFRLTVDLESAVVLEDGFGWAAADLRDQDGLVTPYCWRHVTRTEMQRLADLDISVLVGHEIEFVLIDENGKPFGDRDGWQSYGVGVFSYVGGFASDLCERLARAGVPVEQVHAEYGPGQFEISLPPRDPVTAADNVLLARAVIGRAAREYGLRSSFSPAPYSTGSGNGAHMHLSFRQGSTALLSGGEDQEGLTREGACAIAGILRILPEAMAVLAGTVVSRARLQPGQWAGAYVCWGVENREAAVRLLKGNRGNPHGANVEVKCIDGGGKSVSSDRAHPRRSTQRIG